MGTPPGERPSLEELAGARPVRGLRCPHCSASGEWSVTETRQIVNGVLRIRHCRVCGKRTRTIERVNGVPAYQPPRMG